MVRSRSDTLFDFSTTILLVALLMAVLVPLWYVVVVSVTPISAGAQGLGLLPTSISLEAYNQLLSQPQFIRSTLNSLTILVLGVPLNMVLTVLTAYPLSRKSLPGRNILTVFILITFLFNAGLISTYLLVRNLGLINTFPAVILPGAVSVYNTLVMKSFFENLPESLEEAARIDGANDLQVLRHVVLPLSRPILLTIGLFYTVAHWNEFFTPMLYLNDSKLMTLPVLLNNILSGANMPEYVSTNVMSVTSPEALRMAGVILTMLPMLLIYPWIQRHFIHGTLLGGVKE